MRKLSVSVVLGKIAKGKSIVGITPPSFGTCLDAHAFLINSTESVGIENESEIVLFFVAPRSMFVWCSMEIAPVHR